MFWINERKVCDYMHCTETTTVESVTTSSASDDVPYVPIAVGVGASLAGLAGIYLLYNNWDKVSNLLKKKPNDMAAMAGRRRRDRPPDWMRRRRRSPRSPRRIQRPFYPRPRNAYAPRNVMPFRYR